MDNNQNPFDNKPSNVFFTAVVKDKPVSDTNGYTPVSEPNASLPNNSTINTAGITPQFSSSPPVIENPSSNNLPKRKFNIKILLIIFLVIALGIIGYFVYSKLINPSGKKEKVVELKYWGLFEDPQIIDPIVKEYQTLHPNIKITYTQESHFEYRERLQRQLSQGTGPDIFRFHQSWVPMFGKYLSVIPQTIFDDQSYTATFYPSAQKSLKYNNKYVAIPLMVDGLSLYYNEDIFRDAGKLPPTTWEELRKVASELTVRDSQGKITTAGIAMGTTNNVDHWSDILGLLMLQNGADLTNPGFCSNSGQNKICLGTDALSFYTVFLRGDRPVWDNSLPSSTFSFATGKLAMYFGPSWRAFEIKTQNPSLNFKTLPVPQLSENKISWSSYWVEGVNNKSANATEAWNFLKFLSSKETLQKLYQSQSGTRMFGEPYPRVDMAEMLIEHPIVGSYVKQASYAQNWQLSSFTKDNGINDKIIEYYANAVNAVNEGQDPSSVLDTVSKGVAQILSLYNSSAPSK